MRLFVFGRLDVPDFFGVLADGFVRGELCGAGNVHQAFLSEADGIRIIHICPELFNHIMAGFTSFGLAVSGLTNISPEIDYEQ